MNPPEFTVSSVTTDPEHLIEELHKVFEVMHVADFERVGLNEYQLKGVDKILYEQWKKSRVEWASIVRWVVFENALTGSFFPHELREQR